MMILTTFDTAPDFAIGFVRDIRVRWALEEAGLPYRVESTSIQHRTHFDHQPFGQVPFFRDGEIALFESGAILLHLGEKSPKLLPADAQARAQAVSWLFAALNTVELSAYRLFRYRLQQSPDEPIWRGDVQATLNHCLSRMEAVLQNREWLAGDFSVADIAMSDVLRLAAHFGALADAPACRDYVARATARPAFIKAHQDQLAHFGKMV